MAPEWTPTPIATAATCAVGLIGEQQVIGNVRRQSVNQLGRIFGLLVERQAEAQSELGIVFEQ